MHGKHANVLKDCTICHHRMPREEGDTYGEPVTMAKLRKRKAEPAACAPAMPSPSTRKTWSTPGLKGAYHQLCMDCHQQAEQVPHVRGPIITAPWSGGRLPAPWTPGRPRTAWPAMPKKCPTTISWSNWKAAWMPWR